jgi:hypothetical protein
MPLEVKVTDKVIIEVSGGLVNATWAPDGIEVVVVDHDNLTDEDTPEEDVAEIVAATPELPWGESGYDYRDSMEPPLKKVVLDTTRDRLSPLADS